MADTDVWALSSIGSPAATDRIPIATGSGAGGYSLRGSFIWKDASGVFNGDGAVVAGSAASTAGGLGFALPYSGANLLNTFGGMYSSGSTAIGFAVKPSGSVTDGWVSSAGNADFGRCGIIMGANALRVGFAGVTTTAIGTAITLTEMMTLLAAGNFGLGTGTPAVRFHAKSTSEIARFETTTARGSGACYARFVDPTGSKGYVGYTGGADTLYLLNEMAAALVLSTNGLSVQLATNGYFHPSSDNGQAVGAAANRWNVVYAASGTINTSDERDKTWRGAPTEAELRAAKRIIAELGFYQWNDAIAEKGADGARYHFGVRAQQVWAIMADEELIDPLDDEVTPDCKYAFLCWDEWDAMEPVEAIEEERDEDGNIIVHAQPAQPGREAGDRYGVRETQLMLFLIAAQEARLAALEAGL